MVFWAMFPHQLVFKGRPPCIVEGALYVYGNEQNDLYNISIENICIFICMSVLCSHKTNGLISKIFSSLERCIFTKQHRREAKHKFIK